MGGMTQKHRRWVHGGLIAGLGAALGAGATLLVQRLRAPRFEVAIGPAIITSERSQANREANLEPARGTLSPGIIPQALSGCMGCGLIPVGTNLGARTRQTSRPWVP